MSEKSGLYYPNKMGYIYLQAMEEVMGKGGINAVLNLAKLPHFIDNYPTNNLARELDFSDFTAINKAIEDMYGIRGGRGLALRAGRAAFAQGLSDFGALIGMSELAFKVIPLGTKLKIGLRALAETFSTFSDQKSYVTEEDDHFVYTIERCPVCWERHTDRPVCFAATGVIQEGLRWVSGGKDFKVEQTHCHAMGHDTCDFSIYKKPLS